MNTDSIIVAAIVLSAVAFLLRRAWRTRKAGRAHDGCDNCGH